MSKIYYAAGQSQYVRMFSVCRPRALIGDSDRKLPVRHGKTTSTESQRGIFERNRDRRVLQPYLLTAGCKSWWFF